MMKKPDRMLISRMKFENGPLITPLFNLYLDQSLILKKIFFFFQYDGRKCFNSFVDSVVEASCQGDLNKDSTVVAETMKLIGNSSYGYQLIDRSKHTETKYFNGHGVDKLVNDRFFKTLNKLPNNI